MDLELIELYCTKLCEILASLGVVLTLAMGFLALAMIIWGLFYDCKQDWTLFHDESCEYEEWLKQRAIDKIERERNQDGSDAC